VKCVKILILICWIVALFGNQKVFAQFVGGNNDGFSDSYQCAINLNGNNVFTLGSVKGSATFCNFATETYSVTVSGATANTTYLWSVPSGATITSGQGTTTVLVTFGTINGNVTVNATNDCQTISSFLAVSSSNCVFYAGGSNDGFSDITDCATNLNGGSVFIPGPVVGSTTFCNFATEAYSITVGGTTSTTGYNWTVPVGATITSGQGTNSILVTFGNTNGNVAVAVSNACQTINVSLSVSAANCIFYAGGSNDGFSDVTDCASNLNGGSVFIPGPVVGSTTFCNFATEAYSITVGGSTSTTGYNWTVPVGATITSGQGTNSILVTFGNTNGNVAVAVSNSCQTINVSLPVSAANCIFYAGGSNDGFSDITDCASNLNGGSVFIPGPVVGSTTFCNFATEAYSITVGGSTSTTGYNWTVPVGATITSGQGTNSILVTFGNSNGNVAVAVSNSCQTINVSLAVSATNCIFYAGGSNDGFSDITDCASNLNGGSVFIPGPVVGSTTFCNFATEAYSITVGGSTSTTGYNWTVPVGATITSGQGTNSILVTFGNTNGNVAVAVSNSCQTINVSLAVSATNCIFYAGGSNDGFSDVTDCASNLNGGSVFIPGPVVGSTTFCNFATEAYSITVGGSTSTTGYAWTVPAGATITNGQGTNTILVTFGIAGGNVSVAVSNACQTINVSLAVSPTSCIFYEGGSNDGFSVTLAFNIPLPIQLVSFEAGVEGNFVQLLWATASELNNNFFTIDRSSDGQHFESIGKVDGAGTTSLRRNYSFLDKNPYQGRSYYQLRQTDFDGHNSYSWIVAVNIHSDLFGLVSLYPNPVGGNQVVVIKYLASQEGPLSLSLVDITGKLLFQGIKTVLAGENEFLLTLPFESSGVYILTFQGPDKSESIRILRL
jgi:hypothetical protein